MIRLRKVSLFNDIRKSRTPLYYWSLAGGAVSTVVALSLGYLIYSFRIGQRTRQAIEKGEANQIYDPKGLTSEELEKAIVLLENEKLHERIQLENYQRYQRLRDQRRREQRI